MPQPHSLECNTLRHTHNVAAREQQKNTGRFFMLHLNGQSEVDKSASGTPGTKKFHVWIFIAA